MILNLIYRCCDTVNACSMRKPRIFGLSKQQIVFKCLDSLKMNIDNISNDIDLKIFVVADKCSDKLKEKLNNVFKYAEYEFLNEKTGGNANSFCKCVEIANSLPDNQIVYFLEDDYVFLRNDILNKLVFSIVRLSNLDGQYCAIMLDDYPDRWMNNCRNNVHIKCIETGHFMQIHHTTCTFSLWTNSVKDNIDSLLGFKNWPYVNEDMCINRLWKSVPLFSPIPAWTIHFQEDSTIPCYINKENLKRYMNVII